MFYVAPFFFIYYYYYYSESGYFLQLYRYVYVWVDWFLVLSWRGFWLSCPGGFTCQSSPQDPACSVEGVSCACSQPQAGLCAQADRWRVFALDSIHHRVDFWYKSIVTIPETAGMFQPFVRHIAWLCAPFSFWFWNLTALIVAQMIWLVLTIFFNGDWWLEALSCAQQLVFCWNSMPRPTSILFSLMPVFRLL